MIYLTPGFRKKLADDTRDYIATADITLASGEVLHLTNTEIWGDGFEVEDAVSDDENFTALGATVIGAATLVIDNTSGQYTQYDFMNADVVLKVALMIDDTTGTRKETVKMGTFRVDDTQYNEATISLSMLDYMEQFDRPYSLSNLSYPATLGAIVRDACTICAVRQNTLTFPHDDFEVQERPADESTTFREVLSWAATIAGCFAKVNRDGELVIKWFNTAALEDDSGTDGGYYDDGTPYYSSGDSVDGGSFNPWNTGGTADGGDFTTEIPVHYIGSLYQQNICVDDTVITGVDIEVEDKDTSAEQQKQTYSVGTDGYKIKVTNNPFLTKENAQQVVNWLGQQLVGLTFRKCNVTHTDDPAIEAGDVGFLYDSRQEEYKILITRQKFEIGSPQTIVCGCDTPSHNSATRFTEATKSYVAARKLLKEQVDQYEQAMEDLREDIENNAHGLYAEEIEDPDNPGSYIYCLHDKPRLEQSAVRIHVSTIGVAVTANATAQSPDWYAFRVNGDLLARVIQTMNLFFDYAHGGTLTLGGAQNGNGSLRVLDANGVQIGKWDNSGILNIIGNVYSNLGAISYAETEGGTKASTPTTRVEWTSDNGYSVRYVLNNAIKSEYAIFPQNEYLTEVNYAPTKIVKAFSFAPSKNNNNGIVDAFTFTGNGFTFNYDYYKDKFTSSTTGSYYSVAKTKPYLRLDKDIFEYANAYLGSTLKAKLDSNGIYLLAGSGSIGMSNGGISSNNKRFTIDSAGGYLLLQELLENGTQSRRIIIQAGTPNSSPKPTIDISGSGKVETGPKWAYIGCDNSSNKAYLQLQCSSSNSCTLIGIDNSLRFNNYTVQVNSSSSKRYKHNIKPLSGGRDAHKLLELPIREFEWNDNHDLQYKDMRGIVVPGIIAEDVAEIYPSAVIHDEFTGEIESWDERRIIPGMLALIQEQDKTIKEQQKRLDDQQEQIDKLEKKLEYLMNLTESYSQK